MIRVFVTGTDTGVGKTHVARALIAALAARGRRVAALKPAETGCATAADETLDPADARALLAATGAGWSLDQVCPPANRYLAPVAPSVAARREGRPFSLDRVMAAAAAFEADGADVLVIEGAGGLLVPYTDDLTGAHLARHLGARLLVVARASLGTINHSALTVLEARRRGVDVRAVILNRLAPEPDASEADNAVEIRRLAAVPVFGPLAYAPDAAAAAPARLLDAITDLADA